MFNSLLFGKTELLMNPALWDIATSTFSLVVSNSDFPF